MSKFSDSRQPLADRLPTVSVSIRKLIRCISTQAFLTKERAWTKDMHEACDFTDFAAAYAATTQFPWQDLEIYYSFDPNQPSRWDFAVAGLVKA